MTGEQIDAMREPQSLILLFILIGTSLLQWLAPTVHLLGRALNRHAARVSQAPSVLE